MVKRSFLFVLTCLVLVGCSQSGKMSIRGHLLKNGTPYAPPEGEIVRIMFVPIAQGKERVTDFYAANFDRDDGSFQAAGGDGRGIPPGKYRIAIEHLKNRADIFKGAYDAERSPFVREIKSSADEVTIDLAKPG